MAIQFSTGLVDYLNSKFPMKGIFHGGIMEIYSGSAPSTADAAVTGTKLVTISLASGAVTKEVRSYGTVTLTGGAAGSVDTITVDSEEVMGAAVAFNTSLTQTAVDVATQINNYYNPYGRQYSATSSGAVITIHASPGSGTYPNTLVVASTATTITTSDANMANGVAAVNGLTYGASAAGVLSGSGTWSGTVANSGTAGYFRVIGTANDAGASSTVLPRIQGTCGISGTDYVMTSTTLTAAATHTVDTKSITLSKDQ